MKRPSYTAGLKVAFAILMLAASPLSAKLEDVEAALQKSQSQFNQRFTQFTQDKNFMGRPKTPDGKVQQGIRKTVFNQDDKGPFQSDLTYHDLAYDVEDEQFNKKAEQDQKNGKDTKKRFIYAGISDHGAISAAGGSSQLERVSYSLYDKFAKIESEKEKQQDDEKSGVQYRAVFKVTTQEESKDKGGKNGNDKDSDRDPPQRWELREEAKPEIEKVGENSFQTLEKAAKDEKVDAPNAMPNLAYYYDAATAAFSALWNSTMANLGQRRAYKAIQSKAAPDNIKLSQSAVDGEAWKQQAIQKLQQEDKGNDPQGLQRKIEDINRMAQQYNEIAGLSYREINPRFEKDDKNNGQQGGGANGGGAGGGGGGGGGEEKLVMKGPKNEDALERDWRVQLNILEKAQNRAQDAQADYKYEEKDNLSKVTTQFDQGGAPVQVENLKMMDQVDRYNKNLQAAADGLAEVKSRFPGMPANPQAPLQFRKTGQESPKEISRFPKNAGYEGFETPVAQDQQPPPDTYKGLLQAK